MAPEEEPGAADDLSRELRPNLKNALELLGRMVGVGEGDRGRPGEMVSFALARA